MIERVLWLPERRAATIIIGIGVVFALAYSASLVLRPKPDGRVVIGDALHHYVQLRSILFDGDLHFRNEYIRMYGLRGGEPGAEWIYQDTVTGHVRNLMPVGPAILWAPLFVLVGGLTSLGSLLGVSGPPDGYSRVFQATAGISGVAAAATGVLLSWRASALLFSLRAAAWATLILWLSSSAVYYSLVAPNYSHAASLLATSAFWCVWIRTRETAGTRRYALLGALVGLAALMRWQDVILAASVVVDLVYAWRSGRLSPSGLARCAAAAAGAAAAAFLPQMIVWTVLYGQPLAIPQGPGFMRWSDPALLQVLFSDWHGLLTWTPVCAVAIAGLVCLWRRDARTGSAVALFVLLSWYVNAAVADWWAGEAFGSRRFVSCFPAFALGLAALIERWSPSLRTLAIAGGAVVAHTLLLLVQYQAFMHGLRDVVPYPRGTYNLWLARFIVPFELAREWLTR